MGTFSVQIEVARPYGDEFVPMEALVDTGATYSVFAGHLLEGMGVASTENSSFELADGRVVELPMGYAAIKVSGKQIIAPVVFGPAGTSPLLGATALEIARLAIDPVRQALVPVNALLMTWLDDNSGNVTGNGNLPC
jgi:clan AA aspartic protease